MAKIIVLQGLPASGKSTEATKIISGSGGNYARFNKDDIRASLFPGMKYHHSKEHLVVKTQTSMVKTALGNNYSVVIDDTNFNERHINRWKSLAHENGATFELKKIDTPVHECVKRDLGRRQNGRRWVGEQVIECMAYQYGVMKQGPTILVDLDGTLADIEARENHAKREDGTMDWTKFFDPYVIQTDQPRVDIIEEVNAAKKELGCDMIIVSGRAAAPGGYEDPWINREITIKWLNKYGVNFDRIIMRQQDDHRPDDELKMWMLDAFIGQNNVIRIWDDRPRVIRAWQSRGLDVRDCNIKGVEF